MRRAINDSVGVCCDERGRVYCTTQRVIDWLEQTSATDAKTTGEDYGYHGFMETVDAVVMGRKTFEKLLSFGIPWPYGARSVVVLSRKGMSIPTEIASALTVMAGEPAEILEWLAERGSQNVYVDGGETIRGFLGAGVVDQLILTRIPVLLGDGISLFRRLPHDLVRRHVRTNCCASGFVQSEYAL